MLFQNHPIEIVVVIIDTTTTTTTTTTTAVSVSNNRLNNFRIGLNAARAAIGDSPPQYKINTQQRL